MFLLPTAVCLLSLVAAGLTAEPIDWVNVNYVLNQGKSNGATANARSSIASKAGSTAKDGPWTIQTKGIKPPSGDARDYLSWAPYHWPSCNWCGKGSTHYINGNGTNDDPDDGPDDTPDDSMPDEGDSGTPDPDTGDVPGDNSNDEPEDGGESDDILMAETATVNFLARHSSLASSSTLQEHRRMKRVHRHRSIRSASGSQWSLIPRQAEQSVTVVTPTTSSTSTSGPSESLQTEHIPLSPPQIPTPPPINGINLPTITGLVPGTTTSNRVAGTQNGAEAPAKTQKAKAGCTPSPTKSLAPSATWTTCPYVVRDGKVNPDTNMLKGPDAAQDMSQSVIYNALAYALQKSSSYSKNVANAIDAFFLSSTTGMHPNINFGQLVRGPGKDHQIGTFTGILDLRGMVKVANAIQVMRSAKAPDWTSSRETGMTDWAKSYVSWLQTSDIGKSCATKANNHLTFYVAQVAAVKMMLGDPKGSSDALQKYFTHQFLDQIAQSGEQPFESVRTRPFHYRCFNLEAMIANAKMGDQLGLNFWIAKSKYGATIQTALDYTMGQSAKGEDISNIFPHVAAVAAAYGDPKGRYAAYLQKNDPNYKGDPFWFYDQSGALPNSPAGKTKRSDEDETAQLTPDSSSASNGTVSGPVGATTTSIPFECPEVFKHAAAVELEDGLFVTCDQLKHFYEIPVQFNVER